MIINHFAPALPPRQRGTVLSPVSRAPIPYRSEKISRWWFCAKRTKENRKREMDDEFHVFLPPLQYPHSFVMKMEWTCNFVQCDSS